MYSSGTRVSPSRILEFSALLIVEEGEQNTSHIDL